MISEPPARPPLDPERLAAGTPGLPPDLRVEVHDDVPSTNALAAERARAGEPDGLVVVAEHQTAGRGRLDRTWETPARSALTFSLLLRPSAEPAQWPWLPLLVGYAVDKALKARGLAAGVKWPNDVLVGDQKVAGILVERVDTPQGPAAVVGVGVNVSTTAEELPVATATSLDLAASAAGLGGVPADRTEVLVGLLNTIREAYDMWEAGGRADTARLAQSYATACVTVGREVRVDLPDGAPLQGQAVAVDDGGRLVVQTDDGTRHPVAAGDVVHVRPV